MRDWRIVMLGWIVFCAVSDRVSGTEARSAEKPRSPNVVLVYCDDLGYGDLGCYRRAIDLARGKAVAGGNSEPSPTPHLDRLAAGGRMFTDFYVAQAVCSASRAALLTGCYPNRVGIQGALGPQARHGIHSNEVTLGELFQSRGYKTACYGKWHLGHHPEFLPLRNGFNDYYGLPYSNDMWPKHPEGGKWPALPLINGEKTIAENPDQSLLTTTYTDRAVAFIKEHRAESFFVYVPHTMPHVPVFVSKEGEGKSGRGLFGDVIREIDESVGRIVATVDELGLSDSTLVLFSSDNGPWLSYGDHAGSAGGLREGKGTVWDGGVRVPLIARWPGKIAAGSVCREPAMTIDLFPTLAGLIGGEIPAHGIDGLDIQPLLTGSEEARSPHDALYFYWGEGLEAVRSGDWKLHFPHKYRSLDGKPGGTGGKPSRYTEKSTPLALYQLREDPGETTNVAESHAEVVARLTGLADRARKDLGDNLTKTAGQGRRIAGQLAEPKAAP